MDVIKKMWFQDGDMYVNRLSPDVKVSITLFHDGTSSLVEKLPKMSLIYPRGESQCIVMQINNIVSLDSTELYYSTDEIMNKDIFKSDKTHLYFTIDNNRQAAELFSVIFINQVLKTKRAFSPGEGRIITGVRLMEVTSIVVDFEVEENRSYFDLLINEPRHTINIPSLIGALGDKYLNPLGMKKYILDSLDSEKHDGVEPSQVDEEVYDDNDIKYMNRAFYYSKFGTCDRLQVGAVVVKDGDMIGTGFNSALANTPTCKEVGHFMYDNSCKRTIHAEHNAIFAAIDAVGSLKDAVLYCTDRPCSDCMKLIATSGITKVFYSREYSPKYHLDLGVKLIRLEVYV